MAEEGFGAEPPLARLLLLASRWFDARSLEELERRGWPRLSPAQSLVFAHVGEDRVAPAELARRLGHSRQATHQLVDGLVRLGLLQVLDDPGRRGGRLVQVTAQGRRLAVDAYGILLGLEHGLGARRVRTLRRLLAGFDDGPPQVGRPRPADGGG